MLRGGRAVSSIGATENPRTKAPPAPAPRKDPSSLLLSSPVRSGQSVFFPDGDVTVLGSIASGAEVMAGGSIHVLRRVAWPRIGGCRWKPPTRIFCNRIEAELLSVDRYYRTAEEVDASLRGRPAQAWLNGDTLMVATLE